VDQKTLITDAEKVDASKFAEYHKNTMISPISKIVRASCSVLRGSGFNTDASTYNFPREIKGVVKKTEKRQGTWWRCYQ
jgi:hypothetical protein